MVRVRARLRLRLRVRVRVRGRVRVRVQVRVVVKARARRLRVRARPHRMAQHDLARRHSDLDDLPIPSLMFIALVTPFRSSAQWVPKWRKNVEFTRA